MHAAFLPLVADALITPDLLVPVLSQTAFLLLEAVAGLIFYAYLTDRAVFEGLGRVRSERFDRWDALMAALLVGFFLFAVFQAIRAGGGESEDTTNVPDASRIIQGMVAVAVMFLLFITVILTALHLRKISWRDTFGLSRLSVPGIVGRAVLLLLLAYPLILVSTAVSQVLLSAGGDNDDSSQELVRFFIHSDARAAKWVVAISAMLIAPIQEEFLFRGYIYGVIRRYGGVTLGVLFNSALFALIHLHLPSFGPLFVLAVCLSLAYEWTGSLWVPICMHSLFNSITVINLIYNGKDL